MKKLSEESTKREESIKSFLSLNEKEGTVHYMEPSVGQYGKILVIESPAADMLAEMMQIADDWKLIPLAKCFVAYNSGDRITFFEDEKDYEPNA